MGDEPLPKRVCEEEISDGNSDSTKRLCDKEISDDSSSDDESGLLVERDSTKSPSNTEISDACDDSDCDEDDREHMELSEFDPSSGITFYDNMSAPDISDVPFDITLEAGGFFSQALKVFRDNFPAEFAKALEWANTKIDHIKTCEPMKSLCKMMSFLDTERRNGPSDKLMQCMLNILEGYPPTNNLLREFYEQEHRFMVHFRRNRRSYLRLPAPKEHEFEYRRIEAIYIASIWRLFGIYFPDAQWWSLYDFEDELDMDFYESDLLSISERTFVFVSDDDNFLIPSEIEKACGDYWKE